MRVKEVINILKRNEKDYLKTKTFSKLPGIYAFFFIGDNFPILGNEVKKHQIIYIGKTESSQEKRDANTHFATGKTGSSTVRKSIGAILQKENNLNPIPRNATDFTNGKKSHFKFDDKSETIITDWMEKKLALSFYEYPKSKSEIENLETEIINKLVPILNISKNSANYFKNDLQILRTQCANIAHKQPIKIETKFKQKTKPNSNTNFNTNMKSKGKYTDIWNSKLSQIINELKENSISSIQLNTESFSNVGNRKSYSFNLEFNNGIVSNNIEGSAVARDLASVLANSKQAMSILKSGHHKIRMDKQFCLLVE